MGSNSITSVISGAYSSASEFLFASIIGPLLYQLDLMSWAEDIFDGIDWFLFGCIQIFLIMVVLRTWERLAPAEKQERFAKTSRADVAYTLFHRLGIFHGLFFEGHRPDTDGAGETLQCGVELAHTVTLVRRLTGFEFLEW